MHASLKEIAATHFACGQVRLRFARDLAVALLGLACAPAAWASYGNMRLEGLTFFLVVVLVYLWGVLLAIALALGWGKRKVFVIAATAVTSALVSILIMVFGDGTATMHQRPLGVWAMFVVLLLALLVKLSAGTGNANYTWMLEGKLVWDRLMRAAAGDRFAVAAGLTKQQAQQFTEYKRGTARHRATPGHNRPSDRAIQPR